MLIASVNVTTTTFSPRRWWRNRFLWNRLSLNHQLGLFKRVSEEENHSYGALKDWCYWISLLWKIKVVLLITKHSQFATSYFLYETEMCPHTYVIIRPDLAKEFRTIPVPSGELRRAVVGKIWVKMMPNFMRSSFTTKYFM